jgi:hypothetical protein
MFRRFPLLDARLDLGEQVWNLMNGPDGDRCGVVDFAE